MSSFIHGLVPLFLFRCLTLILLSLSHTFPLLPSVTVIVRGLLNKATTTKSSHLLEALELHNYLKILLYSIS